MWHTFVSNTVPESRLQPRNLLFSFVNSVRAGAGPADSVVEQLASEEVEEFEVLVFACETAARLDACLGAALPHRSRTSRGGRRRKSVVLVLVLVLVACQVCLVGGDVVAERERNSLREIV